MATPAPELTFGRPARIGVLVVAYNAEAHLAKTLDRIPVDFRHRISEVFVCDDASQDDTYLVGLAYKERSVDLPLTIIRNETNLGYGGNQKAGYALAAQHDLDIIVLLHADGQYAPELIPEMIAPIERGEGDAVFGSRMLIRGGALQGGMPLYKFVGNRILTFVENGVLGTRLSEFHSGYRAYNVHALRDLALEGTSDGFNFDTQIIVELVDKKKTIVEIPIPTFYGDEISYVNGLSYAGQVVRDVVAYRVTAPGAPPPSRGLVALVAALSVALVGFLARGVYLFADDYIFLGQARESHLSWDYLAQGLFQHFSPLSRLVDLAAAHVIPGHLWMVWVTLVALDAIVVAASVLLMIALFGRSWIALLGTLLTATSLTLLPLMIWWTAAVNMMPALAGFLVCFAGVVLVVRGRSRWWGLAAIVGYGIGVLDWELAVLAPGAAALWVLLFRSRVTTLSLAGVLKRTWWIWASLAVIAIAWLVNFVQHYYSPSGRADLGEYLQAFWIAVGRTTLPTILGFHDPGLVWFSNVGTALAGLVVLVLVVHTARTRVGAWRGWLFGFAAWLLPIAALLLNRVADYGPGVATHLLYYFLPVTLVIVGALEVWRAPRRAVARGRMPLTVPGRRILALVTVAVLVVGVAAYARSASRVAVGYTVGYSGFTTRLADSARGRSEQGAFSVIDSNVVNVPAKFHPYNRLDRIADVVGVPLNFDGVNPPYAVVDRFGQLHDAQITWVDTELVESSTAGGFQILGMRDLTFVPGEGACFTTVDQFSQVVWPLASPISSDHLVVRAPMRVDTPVEQRLYVAPAVGQDYLPANEDPGKSWQPGSEGTLDTVTSSTIGALTFVQFTPGSRVCLHSLQVGVVTSELFGG